MEYTVLYIWVVLLVASFLLEVYCLRITCATLNSLYGSRQSAELNGQTDSELQTKSLVRSLNFSGALVVCTRLLLIRLWIIIPTALLFTPFAFFAVNESEIPMVLLISGFLQFCLCAFLLRYFLDTSFKVSFLVTTISSLLSVALFFAFVSLFEFS